MRAFLYFKIVAAALLATCGAAQARSTLACGKPSCVLPDTTISTTGQPRPSIAADPSTPSRLVASMWDLACPPRNQVSVSNDDGAHWQSTCLPSLQDLDVVPDESPAVVVNLKGEVLTPAVYYNDHDSYFVGMHRSADDGASWTPFQVIGDTPYYKGRVRSLHATVDTFAGSPHRGAVYVTYTADGPQDDRIHIRLARSVDGGKTWSNHLASPEYDTHGVALKVDAASLAVGRDGTLHMTYTKCEGTAQWRCDGDFAQVLLTVSHDGGMTWQPQGVVASEQLPFRPILAIDASKGPHQGRLHLVTNQRAGGRTVLMARQSSDQGATWSAPVRVASGKGEQTWAQASVSDKGQLAITWMDVRQDTSGVEWEQPMLTLSSDGGASFSKPVALDEDRSDEVWGSEPVSHAWSGGRLRAVFTGPNGDGTRGVRAGGLSR